MKGIDDRAIHREVKTNSERVFLTLWSGFLITIAINMSSPMSAGKDIARIMTFSRLSELCTFTSMASCF